MTPEVSDNESVDRSKTNGKGSIEKSLRKIKLAENKELSNLKKRGRPKKSALHPIVTHKHYSVKQSSRKSDISS